MTMTPPFSRFGKIDVLLPVKAFLKKTIWSLGYEVRKVRHYSVEGAAAAIVDGAPSELDGLTYRDFLECYFFAVNRPDFFFVQLGAHNGVSNADDVLRDYVIQFNLRGLLVEPQSEVFKELQENYKRQPGLILENAAVGHENARRQLYTIRRDLDFLAYANQAASFSLDHVRRMLEMHLKTGAAQDVTQRLAQLGLGVDDCIEAETVQSYTFQALLNKHGVRRVDLLQIDTEGFDYEIIKMANLKELRPTVVNYEHEHLTDQDRLRCWCDLRALDYRLFTHGGDTCAYRPNWQAGPPNLHM